MGLQLGHMVEYNSQVLNLDKMTIIDLAEASIMPLCPCVSTLNQYSTHSINANSQTHALNLLRQETPGERPLSASTAHIIGKVPLNAKIMACRLAERAIILSISVRPDVSILKCLSYKSKADSSGWVSLPSENIITLPSKLCPTT